jgi:hypothetical protein
MPLMLPATAGGAPLITRVMLAHSVSRAEKMVCELRRGSYAIQPPGRYTVYAGAFWLDYVPGSKQLYAYRPPIVTCRETSRLRLVARSGPATARRSCPCECNQGGFCVGCGHVGCAGRR